MDVSAPLASTQHIAKKSDAALKEAAQKLEASFLAEMLKSAGLGKQGAGDFGGIGEDQFTSFLVQAHAEQLAKSGGLGLSEAIFEALKERQNDS